MSNQFATDTRNEIKRTLHLALKKYIDNFEYQSKHPLDLLIPHERLIRSVVGGLETSMGITVWEPIARILASRNNFKVVPEKILMPNPMPGKVAQELYALIKERESRETWVPISEVKRRLREVCKSINDSTIGYISPPAGTGVDILLEKEGKYFAFDIKTVQPNLGSIKSFNKQLIEWYAYSFTKNPQVVINCQIAYPYNPHSGDFWSRSPHSNGSLEPKIDALVEGEFWDFISGSENTYDQIVEIFRELATEGLGQELSELISLINIPQ